MFAASLGFAIPAWTQGVGGIGGAVMDSSGAVLPGVAITLSSAQGGTLGGSQETVSDERGNGWMMTGGVSIGKTTGWVGNTDLNNPNS